MEGGGRQSSALASTSADGGGASAGLRVGGWAALGAGILGLIGLASVIPWPSLFSLDANPGNAIVLDPGLKGVLVGHYAILVAGAALGLTAAIALVVALRPQATGVAGGVLLVVACSALGYASAVRALDLAVNDGRPTQDVTSTVWAGGGILLVAVVLVTLALRQRIGVGFFLLGLSTPILVAAGVTAFAVLGPEVYPEIWGITFPPPTDYLLAIWFIGLSSGMRRGWEPVSADRPT